MLPSQEPMLFVLWGSGRKAGVGNYWDGRVLCTKPLLMCCSVCVCNNLAVCSGILGPRECPLRIFFGPKSFLFGTTSKSCCCCHYLFKRQLQSRRELQVLYYTACLLKAQHSSLALPAPLPFWLGDGAILFPRTRVLSHCAIEPPGSQEGLEENWLTEPGALGGLESYPSVLGTVAGWSASMFLWPSGRMPHVLHDYLVFLWG